MQQHMARMALSDSRANVFMSEHRWFMLRALLLGLLHMRHLSRAQQGWFYARIERQMSAFRCVQITMPEDQAVDASSSAVAPVGALSEHIPLTLSHPRIGRMLTSYQMVELAEVAAAAASLPRKAPPPRGFSDADVDVQIPLLDERIQAQHQQVRTIQTERLNRLRQQQRAEVPAQPAKQPQPPSITEQPRDLSFL
jgi:hypothetical protein